MDWKAVRTCEKTITCNTCPQYRVNDFVDCGLGRSKTPTPTGEPDYGLTQGEVKPRSAWDTQVGGDHYRKMKIQPFQFSMANRLDPMQHTIVKYVTRFRDKNGIEDLEKAKQTIDLLIAWEKEHAATH